MFWQSLFLNSLLPLKKLLEVTLPDLRLILSTGAFILPAVQAAQRLAGAIAKETKMQVHIPEKPLDCVAIGTSIKLRRAQ